jgi:hypothetical protein
MATLDFPSNPSVNDQHMQEQQIWYWTGDSWAILGTPSANGPHAATIIDIVYPVGSIYISLLATDPAIQWVGTAWELDSVDTALVGAGGARVGGDAFGADTHALTEAELASHDHSVDPPSTNTNNTGAHTHSVSGSIVNGNGYYTGYTVNATTANQLTQGNTALSAGSHTHSVNIASFTSGSYNFAAFNSASKGSGNSHSSVQASKAFYLWRRTA